MIYLMLNLSESFQSLVLAFIISALISALDNLLVPILCFGGRTENFRFLFRPVKSSGFSPAGNLMS